MRCYAKAYVVILKKACRLLPSLFLRHADQHKQGINMKRFLLAFFLVALFFASSVNARTEQEQQENLWRATFSYAICSGWYRFNNGPAMKTNTEALRWRRDTLRTAGGFSHREDLSQTLEQLEADIAQTFDEQADAVKAEAAQLCPKLAGAAVKDLENYRKKLEEKVKKTQKEPKDY